MKKLLAYLVALCVVFSFNVSVFAAGPNDIFTDVDASTDVGKDIYKLFNAGIVSGNGDGTFTPQNPVTRAELCKMVNNLRGYKTPAEVGFSDVTSDKWYYNHVLIGKQAGYINGFPDGTFRGDDYITREQVCAIVCRAFGIYDLGLSAGITDEVSDWALPYVNALVTNKLISLEEGNTFRATQDMKRGELSTTLSNFVVSTPVVTPPSTGGTTGGSVGGSIGGSMGGSSGTGGNSGTTGGGNSGTTGGDNSGTTGGDNSGTTGGDNSGTTGGDNSGTTGGDNSGTTGGDNNGTTGGDNSGTTGGDNSGTTGGDNSGTTGGDNSGTTGGDNSGTTGGDNSGTTGGDNSGTTGGDNSGTTGGDNNGTTGGDNSGTTGGDNTGSGDIQEPDEPQKPQGATKDEIKAQNSLIITKLSTTKADIDDAVKYWEFVTVELEGWMVDIRDNIIVPCLETAKNGDALVTSEYIRAHDVYSGIINNFRIEYNKKDADTLVSYEENLRRVLTDWQYFVDFFGLWDNL